MNPKTFGPECRLSSIDTPLGPMVALADEVALYLLEFADRYEGPGVKTGKTAPLHSIEEELSLYFRGQLEHFATPIHILGSAFQKTVWSELRKIPMGATCSYAEVAQAIGRPSAVRAVAQANRVNPFAIIVPCHRVIYTSGGLGGYAGGLERKRWLLAHEAQLVDRLLEMAIL